ncbi:MAG: 1-deoxy-D-xylulose-5-phosphate synthase [Eubacteriales bacterium]
MKNNILDYDFPKDLKLMNEKELELLSYEIRDFLIDKVSKTGGHIASNLGVVELSIALHKVYDSPIDKIIWDVGHQSYVHKILTGRAQDFDKLRKLGGLSGFPKRAESMHDVFDSGHSSNSISIALGVARARTIKGGNESVVAVIGDGALTGGIAYEALNNAGHCSDNITVILNDNEMSIGKNCGGMSEHLYKLRMSTKYNEIKKQLKRALTGIPVFGEGLLNGLEHIRDGFKYAIVPGAIFEELGFRYFGPVDGHDIAGLVETLSIARQLDGPVLIHILTSKGKGYKTAERNPSKFHGIGPFDPETGDQLCNSNNLSYSKIFGNKLVELGIKNENIVAISAAMIDGTGLESFSEKFPQRTFDVGIAEQHAVSFAAGLALNGMIPVVAIYSTFLQRAYDQIMFDICLQNLPVVFAIDRAGNVGQDGETHHGNFDISFLSHIPNLTILAPKDGKELEAMLEYAVSLGTPCAIRYPKGDAADLSGFSNNYSIDGTAEILKVGVDATLIPAGKMVSNTLLALELIKSKGYNVEIINPKFIKPMDIKTIISSGNKTKLIVTIEDNSTEGGFGSAMLKEFSDLGVENISFKIIGWPDKFIEQGSVQELETLYNLDPESIARRVCGFIERKT